MENKTIEQQVAELTQEQKEIILKVGKGTGRVVVLMVALAIYALGVLIPVFLNSYYSGYKAFCMIGILVMVVLVVAFNVYPRIKYPFYSEKLYNYLKKNK